MIAAPAYRHALAIPDLLAAQSIAIRAETPDDEPFLERLYLSVRWEELAQAPWPNEFKATFLKDQFALQRRHYLTHYYDTDYGILTESGQPIGRLYLFRNALDIRIVDISLLPESRNRGIGGALLRAIFAEAEAGGRTVSIHVEEFNPAQRLYERMGFREIGRDGPYRLMEWRAEGERVTV